VFQIAVDIFSQIPDISIGDISLRNSRFAILLKIRFTYDPPSITARTVNGAVAGRLDKWLVIHSFQPYEL